MTNRDEQHARPAALPPAKQTFGTRCALLPIDPASGGTWVAANDAGMVITLLNLNPPNFSAAQPQNISRGGVIPNLLSHGSVAEAVEAIQVSAFNRMMPFRLLLTDDQHTAVVSVKNSLIEANVELWRGEPLMLTSSGLGDHVVETPRRALFESKPPLNPAEQDGFHAHRWADRPYLSVMMNRPDARTVSQTIVEVSEDVVSMIYTPIADDLLEGPAHRQAIPRTAGARA